MMMLFILLLLAFVARGFFTAAQHHNKNPLVFAVIGVVTFLVATVGFCFVIKLGVEIEFDWILLGSYPIGLLSCWLVYAAFKRSWEKEKPSNNTGALDDISET